VMNLHRLLVDVRFERVGGIRKGGECVSHRASKRGRPEGLHYGDRYRIESILSSATFVQCFCSSGTTMRLCTSPATSPSSVQSRWFGETRNIVEHRQPN